MSEITKNDIIEIIQRMFQKIEENKDYLSKLDTEIGDGDHGFSIANGFHSLSMMLNEFSELSIGDLLKKSGFELIKTMGGAAGAIFGTFFTGQASYYDKNLAGKEELTLEEYSKMLSEALTQIKNRGHAEVGDKTMIDALEPAIRELERGAGNNLSVSDAFKNAADKAQEGAEKTKEMVGKRGRAKYVGERGQGFIDPGAMSTSFLFRAMVDYFTQIGK